MKLIHSVEFEKLISLENLFGCWQEFRIGKTRKPDVMQFERNLEDNIFSLHALLKTKKYRHSGYHTFHIFDPKHRVISKAAVKDRLIHHLVFGKLYELFDSSFIFHSYASRLEKGTHLAVRNVARSLRRESQGHRRNVFVLKCDIRKFFASVSHQKLLQLIENKIKDSQFLWLTREIVGSFSSNVDNREQRERELRGIPIGNLTSQIFANIYLNELDQFVKHKLRIKHYFRYADDFVIVHSDANYLSSLIPEIGSFLKTELALNLHPRKIQIRKFRQGIDFLGYVILPYHIVLRTKTKQRMFRKLSEKQEQFYAGILDRNSYNQSLQSYLGIMKHCDSYDLQNLVKNSFLNTSTGG